MCRIHDVTLPNGKKLMCLEPTSGGGAYCIEVYDFIPHNAIPDGFWKRQGKVVQYVFPT